MNALQKTIHDIKKLPVIKSMTGSFNLSIKCITIKNCTNFLFFGILKGSKSPQDYCVNPLVVFIPRASETNFLSFFCGLMQPAPALPLFMPKRGSRKGHLGACSGNIQLVALPPRPPRIVCTPDKNGCSAKKRYGANRSKESGIIFLFVQFASLHYLFLQSKLPVIKSMTGSLFKLKNL
jgi:hypothetical protein